MILRHYNDESFAANFKRDRLYLFFSFFPASPRGKTQSHVKFQTTGLYRQLKKKKKKRDRENTDVIKKATFTLSNAAANLSLKFKNRWVKIIHSNVRIFSTLLS